MESLGDILKRRGWPTSGAGFQRQDPDGRRKRQPDLTVGPGQCALCGGVGFLYSEFDEQYAEQNPEYGKAIPCICTSREMDDQQVRRLQRYSNLGPLLDITFEATSPLGRIEASQKEFASALERAKRYAENPAGWFVITGSSGSGKTHIAAAIANAAIARGEPAFFVVIPDLLDHLRATYGPQSTGTYDELFEQVRDAPLLILDDLGAHSTTAWAQEKLFQLLNHRYNGHSSTVVTISGPIDSLDERLRNRLTAEDLVELCILDPHQDDLFQYQGALALDLLRWMTFEHFDPRGFNAKEDQQQTLRAAYEDAVKFAQYPYGWLVLTGPVGCGKTHLAAAIANDRVAKGEKVFFAVVPDLLDHLRATYAPQSTVPYDALFESIKRTPLLVLDDLGTQTASPWAEEKLFQLINHRYNALLPTVITTVLDLDDLAKSSRPIASRLRHKGFSTIVPVDAPDFRPRAQASVEQSQRPSRSASTRQRR